jgi:nucleoid-associated protein YgaU
VRRFARLAAWVVVAGGGCAAFLWMGRFAPVPFRWSTPAGWLSEVERDDAFVEVARWIGVALSGYVCVSAMLALLAEAAAAVRLVPVARFLARVGRLSAVPMLRQRLWRSVSSVALSASAMVMATPGAAAGTAPTSVELSVDGPASVGDPIDLPGELVGAFSGFGLDGVRVIAPPTDSPSTGAVERVVVRGDTVWDLAYDVYGRVDADIVRHVAVTNSLEDPSLIFPGQRLLFIPLPAAVDVAPSPTVGASWATHTVVAGDTLWEVLEAHYGWVTADLVWHVAAVNNLDDPSMIAIGTVIALPSLAEEPNVAAELPPPIAADPPASELTPPTAVPQQQTGESVATTTFPVPATTSSSPPQSPAVTSPASIDVTPTTVELVDDSTERDAPSGDLGLFDTSTRTLWWQVPMGLLLAAGLATMARRLRGRRALQMQPGEQLAAPPPTAAGTELAVTTATPAHRLETLQALLRSVTPHAREQPDPPAVRVVEFSDDRIEILFADAAPFPPEGWSSINGGRSWVHDLDGDSGVCSVRQLVTPALVTLGRRVGGGEVLLDLETAGSLALTGDRATSLGIARSMVLELATYSLGVPMDVCLIGFDVDGVEHCDRVWSNTTLTRAVRVARETLERTTATGAVSLVSARAATDEDTGELDPQVFVVDLDAVVPDERHLVDELVELCQPLSGAAVIVIGEHPDAVERVDARAPELAVWSGAELVPPVVAREAAAQVAVMFDHLANAPAEPMTTSPAIADALRADDVADDASSNDDDPAAAASDSDEPDVLEYVYEPPPYEVLVRCLGEVTVEGRDIVQAGEVELLALLTLQREIRPNIDTIYTLLVDDPFLTHGKRPVPKEPLRPTQQRVSRLRVKLGTDAEGNDLLPAAKPGRGSPSRCAVSPSVLTDVEILEHRYHTSFELSSEEAFLLLRDGLAMFRGPMMRAKKGYSWAATEGITSRIGTFVIAYAVRLMELAFDRNDIPTVLETVRCCGLVLDDPLVELQAWQRIDDFAEASSHPDLVAAVHKAHLRLATYVDETDPVAETDV